MYCRKCGEKIDDDAVFCMFCGSPTNELASETKPANPEHDEPKTFMGVLLALVLGIWGLLIGLFMYPSGSYARKSFIRAWVTTIIVSTVIGILLAIVMVSSGYEFMTVYENYY